ncbi:MAG: 16S rRNA (cytosine(1402)-N(4))-methyltransferase RsmH [Candidatus Liptonbacteria bacterium]|nr:16S rRNA (cytosine(1402)-N(4))-methyltransferase RsmH [Candidatus Liptonbacteria bacterium]
MTHQPVLLKEVIEVLHPRPGSFVIDGTIDGGGHAAAILERIVPGGRFLGVDWDGEAVKETKRRIAAIPNHQFLISKPLLVHGNYADLPAILKKKGMGKADGLLLDLGFSSEQLESAGGRMGKGFSFAKKDEPLLMTYDAERKPVKKLLRELSVRELARIIHDLSGERFAMRVAEAIKEKMKAKPIETTRDLRDIVHAAVPRNYEHGRIDPATRTFQALRIYANDELGNLRKLIDRLPEILKPGGRAAIISFHSLEDKIVKDLFRDFAKRGIVEILTKKPIVPSREEIYSNRRSRSAKLRAAQLV